MSLILEALKKSEAERRGTSPITGTPRTRHRGPIRGVLMAAIALAGIAAGWWGARQWTRPDAPAIAVRSEAPVPSEPGTPGQAPAAESAAEPEPVPETQGASVAATPASVAVSEPPPAPVAIETAPASRTPATGVRPPVRAAPARAREAARPAPEPAPTVGLPRFNQLPGLRSEVGNLVLNMLVYSTQAESRFALINLKRVVEGDQLAPGLTVREIRRDGVVLSHRGEAVLLTSGN